MSYANELFITFYFEIGVLSIIISVSLGEHNNFKNESFYLPNNNLLKVYLKFRTPYVAVFFILYS